MVAMPRACSPATYFLLCVFVKGDRIYMYVMHARGLQTDGKATNSCYRYGDVCPLINIGKPSTPLTMLNLF